MFIIMRKRTTLHVRINSWRFVMREYLKKASSCHPSNLFSYSMVVVSRDLKPTTRPLQRKCPPALPSRRVHTAVVHCSQTHTHALVFLYQWGLTHLTQCTHPYPQRITPKIHTWMWLKWIMTPLEKWEMLSMCVCVCVCVCVLTKILKPSRPCKRPPVRSALK